MFLMHTFCTIFDKNYLYQGVVLYNSLKRFVGDFKLYTLCMDSTAYALMAKMCADDLIPIDVDELINPETALVRERTTHGQFCWICQALFCQFVLDSFNVDMVTYLEADSMFFSNPEVLFEELGDGSVSLVPHNYSPNFDRTATSGKFCTQFISFRNNQASREVLAFWKSWCYKYDKNAPFFIPSQVCLDYWPERFDCVRIIHHFGAGVAPWNIQRFKFEIKNSVPHVDGVPIVFYHFHEYGRYPNGAHELGHYPLPREVINSVYKKYIDEIKLAEIMVREVDATFRFQKEYQNTPTLKDLFFSFSTQVIRKYLSYIRRKWRRRYNVFPDKYFSQNPKSQKCQ